MGYSRFCQVVNINHHLSEIVGSHQIFQELSPSSVILLSLNCDWELGVSSRQEWLRLLSFIVFLILSRDLGGYMFRLCHNTQVSYMGKFCYGWAKPCQNLSTAHPGFPSKPLSSAPSAPHQPVLLVKGAHISGGQEAV